MGFWCLGPFADAWAPADACDSQHWIAHGGALFLDAAVLVLLLAIPLQLTPMTASNDDLLHLQDELDHSAKKSKMASDQGVVSPDPAAGAWQPQIVPGRLLSVPEAADSPLAADQAAQADASNLISAAVRKLTHRRSSLRQPGTQRRYSRVSFKGAPALSKALSGCSTINTSVRMRPSRRHATVPDSDTSSEAAAEPDDPDAAGIVGASFGVQRSMKPARLSSRINAEDSNDDLADGTGHEADMLDAR